MFQRKRRMMLLGMLLSFALLGPAQAQEDTKQQSREIFKELIEINTTDSVGNVTTAAEALAKRLRDAGFPEQDVIVAGPNDHKKNLVARLHGTGQQNQSCFSPTWMSSRRAAKTGPPIPFNLSKKMAISTAAAPWTSKTALQFWLKILSA